MEFNDDPNTHAQKNKQSTPHNYCHFKVNYFPPATSFRRPFISSIKSSIVCTEERISLLIPPIPWKSFEMIYTIPFGWKLSNVMAASLVVWKDFFPVCVDPFFVSLAALSVAATATAPLFISSSSTHTQTWITAQTNKNSASRNQPKG